MCEWDQAIYNEGYNAAIANECWQTNPYPCDTEEHDTWHNGWESGSDSINSQKL